MTYPIWEIDPADVIDDEQLGSKEKFWFARGAERWLFKEARIIQTAQGNVVTGEDWAEKAAAEIASLLSIRAAKVELAEYQGKRGSASLNFISSSEHLEHGNEVLTGRVLGYDPDKKHKQSDHTIENIVLAVRNMFPDENDRQFVLEQLAGYVVFDALICNTDRHHENWGLIWRTVRVDEPTDDWDQPVIQRIYNVAPSFDHASSLGREMLDRKRTQFLHENRVQKYVRNGKGGIYWRSTDKRGENPLQLVESAARLYPAYFRPGLQAIASVPLAQILAVFDMIPESRISANGREFAKAMLSITYPTLIGLTT